MGRGAGEGCDGASRRSGGRVPASAVDVSLSGYRDAWGILEKYPRATFAVLDRAGHGVAGEQPVLFEALVGDWLDRVSEHRERPDGHRG